MNKKQFEKMLRDAGGKSGSNQYIVPLSFIEVRHDCRERNTARYFEHFKQVKEGIVIAKGVKDALQGYQGRGESDGKFILTNGRTRFYAACEAVEDGSLGEGLTLDDVLVKVDLEAGDDIDHLASEFRAQNSLELTFTEKAKLIEEALSLAAGEVAIVAKSLSMPQAKIQQLIDFNNLPVRVKKMVESNDVAFTVALDAAKDYDGKELIEILSSAETLKKERNESGRAKGKGYKSNQLTKADLYVAELRTNGNYEETISKQRDFISEAVTLEDIDPYVLLKVNNLLEKELRRLEKGTQQQDLETTGDEEE